MTHLTLTQHRHLVPMIDAIRFEPADYMSNSFARSFAYDDFCGNCADTVNRFEETMCRDPRCVGFGGFGIRYITLDLAPRGWRYV
jgi:hypothetical protein